MNFNNLYNSNNPAESFLSRVLGRLTGGAIINIIVFLFVAAILLMTFLYVGLIFLKNL